MIELCKRIEETRQQFECFECSMIKKTIIKSQKEYQQQRPDIGDLTNFNRHNMTRGFPEGGMSPVLLPQGPEERSSSRTFSFPCERQPT